MTAAALLIGAVTLSAQDTEKNSHPFSISLQGGGIVSINENYFSYSEHGKTFDLLTPQGGIAFGYDFSPYYSARLSASYGKNAGACNTRQTDNRFYPYQFNSINVFADVIYNFTDIRSKFVPRAYIGVGGARTFGFTDSGHPWQKVSGKNLAFGFRGGFIAQYNFTERFGLFADLCGEAYTDSYNGINPVGEVNEKGRPGFPLDMRGVLSCGLVFHF